MQLKLNTIPTLLQEFKDLTGNDRFLIIDTYIEEGLSEGALIEKRSRTHPLALLWHTLNIDLRKSFSSEKLLLSRDSIITLDLVCNILAVKNLKFFDYFFNDFWRNDTFKSTCFEASVASYYHNAGFQVEFVPRTDNNTPDLKVFTADSKLVQIECKSLSDKIESERVTWELLLKRVSRGFKRLGKAGIIDIYPKSELSGKMTDDIYHDIIFLVQQVETKSINKSDYRIEINSYFDFNERIPFDTISFAQLDLGRIECEIFVEEDKYYITNIAAINIKNFYNPNKSGAILNHLKKANKQVRNIGGASVLHIESPYIDNNISDKILTNCIHEVYEKMNKDYKRIGAVVLNSTHLPPFELFPDSYTPLYTSLPIPNHNTIYPLPENFKIMGTHDFEVLKSLKEVGKTGTLYFDFFLDNFLEKKPGFEFVRYISNDGQYQLRCFHSSVNTLKVIYSHPDIGLLMEEFIVDNLVPFNMNKILIRWLPDELDLFVNGAKSVKKTN